METEKKKIISISVDVKNVNEFKRVYDFIPISTFLQKCIKKALFNRDFFLNVIEQD